MQAGELIRQLQQDGAVAPLLPFLTSGPQDGRWVPVCALPHPGTLVPLLDAFAVAEGRPGEDVRAIASLWSRWHFWATQPPLVAALLLHRQVPALQAVQLSPVHRTCGVSWQASGASFAPESARAACEHLVQQERLLIESLAEVSGTSPRVFWNNLGNLLEYLVTQLRAHPGACPRMLRAFDELLASPALADGCPNPVQQPVRYLPDPESGTDCACRIRRVCCLYYLLPGTDLCENCPRPAR